MSRRMRTLLIAAMSLPILSLTAPAAAGESQKTVAVHMKKGTGYATYYGDRPIYGIESPESTDKVLVLGFPGGGQIRVPREAVDRVVPVETLLAPQAPARAESPAGRTIKTTHLVVLANGQKIRGNLASKPDENPVKIDLPGIGWLTIPRARVSKVEESAGEIAIPESPPEPPPQASKTEGDQKPETPGTEGSTTPPAPEVVRVPPEIRAEIEEAVYDLTRWRSRDRVRAERRLVDIGAVAIPFIQAVAHDPFDLTRRAAMRIVRDIGSQDGIPIAIEGLLDEDRFVRETAAEALRRMTGLDLGYRPDASVERRLESYRRWVAWWEDRARS
jgi:hypothetical protein